MFKCNDRIRKIEERKKELLKTRDHLSTWQLLTTPSPPGLNEEYKSLEKELKEIYKSQEWKEERKERTKLYKQDERWVKLEHEIEQLHVKLISAGYFPHARPIEGQLEEAKIRLEELEVDIENNLSS